MKNEDVEILHRKMEKSKPIFRLLLMYILKITIIKDYHGYDIHTLKSNELKSFK